MGSWQDGQQATYGPRNKSLIFALEEVILEIEAVGRGSFDLSKFVRGARM